MQHKPLHTMPIPFLEGRKITQAMTLLILLLTLVVGVDANAQCAMCKAVAESDMKNGGTGAAANINEGILYLMSIPYLLFAATAAYFFRKPILKKIKGR